MSTIENDQISLYCHFNKIIKGSDSSFQSVALSQEFVLKIQKKQHKCNFHDVSMPLMTSQILTSDDFSKTQKSRYLENEMRFSNKKINSLQIKSYFIPKNNFVVEVVFNYIRKKSLSWINPFVSNAPFLYGKGF